MTSKQLRELAEEYIGWARAARNINDADSMRLYRKAVSIGRLANQMMNIEISCVLHGIKL